MANPKSRKVRRVLVVDDNMKAAKALATLLMADGYEVMVAHDGDGALAGVHEFTPDAIVLDVDLPKKNGYEVARILRESLCPALIIALTGHYGREEDKLKAQEVGFDHYLTRPVLATEIEMLFRAKG
jgi:DNA-binding response OmpR family regulator